MNRIFAVLPGFCLPTDAHAVATASVPGTRTARLITGLVVALGLRRGSSARMPGALRLIFGAAPIVLAGLSTAYAADGPETVQQVAGPSGHTVWRITRPRVNQRRTEYPQIRFGPDTTVVVDATGCVQHGGQGKTTKLYVDPAGDDADRFYHGEIAIPGATAGLVFFEKAQPTVYTIPAGANLPTDAHLSLGYTDRDAAAYKDNGYKNLDSGNYDQCLDQAEAVVTIDIAPTPPVAAAPATASYAFSIDSVVIRHLRSQHNDTDVLSAGVLIDGTPSDVVQVDGGKWSRGAHPGDLKVLIDSVTPTDRISIGYAILNAGHPTAQQTTTLVTGAISGVLKAVPTVGSLLGAVADGIGSLINLGSPDCDGPVVAGAIPATGQELFLWTHSTQAYRRTVTFPGVRSADGCGGDSFYQVTFSIVPGSPDGATGVEPFSLKIDAHTKAAVGGAQAVLLRHQ